MEVVGNLPGPRQPLSIAGAGSSTSTPSLRRSLDELDRASAAAAAAGTPERETG